MTGMCLTLVSAVMLAQTGAQPEKKEGGMMGAKAHVAFVHAASDAPAVEVLVNGISVAKGLAFGKSESKEVAGGPAKIELKAGDKVVLTKDATLAADKMYTIVTFGPKDKLEAQVIEAKTPAAGKAHVFFVHASADAGNATINVDKKPVGKDIATGKTGETTVEPGKHTIEVLAGSADPALTTDLDAKADTCYTVVVAGPKGALKAIVASHTMPKKASMTPAPMGEKKDEKKPEDKRP